MQSKPSFVPASMLIRPKRPEPLTVNQVIESYRRDLDDIANGRFYGTEGPPPEQQFFPRPGHKTVFPAYGFKG